METVGERVRRYRRLRRLTQDALAAKADVDRRYLGRIETGDVAEPGVDTVVKIAHALGVSVRAIANPGWYDDEGERDWLSTPKTSSSVWCAANWTGGTSRPASERSIPPRHAARARIRVAADTLPLNLGVTGCTTYLAASPSSTSPRKAKASSS